MNMGKMLLMQSEDRVGPGEGCSGSRWIYLLVSSGQLCLPLWTGTERHYRLYSQVSNTAKQCISIPV